MRYAINYFNGIETKILFEKVDEFHFYWSYENLVEFAKKHSVIIFVSGKESSNGKVLYDLCRSVNPKSYHIEHSRQIDNKWFSENDSVGICGATSTPKWQLEHVSEYLKKL